MFLVQLSGGEFVSEMIHHEEEKKAFQFAFHRSYAMFYFIALHVFCSGGENSAWKPSQRISQCGLHVCLILLLVWADAGLDMFGDAL